MAQCEGPHARADFSDSPVAGGEPVLKQKGVRRKEQQNKNVIY